MSEQQGENKVIKAGIGYTVGNYMLKGLSFLAAPIFSRILSTADYGVFNSYLAYQCMVFLIIGFSLQRSLKNAKYRYGEKLAQYNSCCVLLTVCNLGIWMLLGNLFYPLYGELLGFSRFVVNLLMLDSFGTALIQFFNAYVGLDYRYASFLKLSAFNTIANLVLSVLLILTVFKDDRATGRIAGNALPVILIAVALICYFWKKAKPVFQKEYIKFGLTYSLPSIPQGICELLISQFDRLMIKHMIGDSESGIYSFGYTIFMIINVTISSLDNVWGPWFYERMEAKDYEGIRKYSSKYAFGMMLFAAMLMLGSPELVKLLGAREYWDAMYSAIPLIAGGFFLFLYSLPSMVEYYYAKTNYIAFGTGLAALVNVVLNLVCIRRFGYLAASYTTLVTYMLFFAFHYVIAARVHKGSIFAAGRLALYSAATLLAGAASLIFIGNWLVRWLILVILGVIFVLWAEKEFGIAEKIKNKLHRA